MSITCWGTQKHNIMDTVCRLAGPSQVSNPLPRAGSAQGIIPWGLETLQGEYGITSLGLSPLPSYTCGGKAFPYLQLPWPCSVCCLPGLRTFSAELSPGLVSLLPGLCLSGIGVDTIREMVTKVMLMSR